MKSPPGPFFVSYKAAPPFILNLSVVDGGAPEVEGSPGEEADGGDEEDDEGEVVAADVDGAVEEGGFGDREAADVRADSAEDGAGEAEGPVGRVDGDEVDVVDGELDLRLLVDVGVLEEGHAAQVGGVTGAL